MSNCKIYINEKTLSLPLKIFYFGTFRPEFEIFIAIFEISFFDFVKMQSFILTKKNKFGTKIVLFGFYWTAILNNYCPIRNLHLRVCQNATSHIKHKKLCQKCLILVFFGQNL